MNVLTTTSGLETLDQLAILTKIRQELADGKEEPQISEIIRDTNLLDIINQVLGLNDATNQHIRFLKVSINSQQNFCIRIFISTHLIWLIVQLEATWILTNMAFGNESDLKVVLDSKYGIIKHLNRMLEGNDL